MEFIRDSGGRFGGGRSGTMWNGLHIIANNINRRGTTLNQSRKRAVNVMAARMEIWAQENAAWEDRSGDARAGLQTVVQHDDDNDESTIWLGHGVDYGLWLELDPDLAIIIPTLEHFGPELMGEVVEHASLGRTLARVFQ